jgi:tetratricopeptide (TPR) repeat protein
MASLFKAAAVNEASEKPERIWPVTWAAIIVGSGTVLLLLWALVFRDGKAPQQQAEKDQPLLTVAQSAAVEPSASRAAAPANETTAPLPANDPAADGVLGIVRRARAHAHAGDFDSAIADGTDVIRLDPTCAFAYSGRGMAYLLKGDYDSAIADCTEAIRLDPKDADALLPRLGLSSEGPAHGGGEGFCASKETGLQAAHAGTSQAVQVTRLK